MIPDDGQFTISDLAAWAEYLGPLPADVAIFVLIQDPPGTTGSSLLGKFLELDATSYGGWGAWVLSAPVWLLAAFLTCAALLKVASVLDDLVYLATKPHRRG